MKTVKEQILEHVKLLIGLQLSYARRAADMRNFGFGKIRDIKGGFVAEYALHVQCPWRIEGSEGIVTGRLDLYEPAETLEGDEFESWDYEQGNLQDVLIGELLRGYDSKTRTSINTTQKMCVEDVQADDFGGLCISLSDGYRLVLFPAGSRGEDWRLFSPESNRAHFVICGGRIEEENE